MFRVGIQPGWLETLRARGETGQYDRESPDLFLDPVIGLTSRRLTRCCFRTPVTVKGDISKGIPLHVSLPRSPGVIRAALRLCRASNFQSTMRLENWSDRRTPLSLTRTAYKIVGGTLKDMLAKLESRDFLPPKRDHASNEGVWHVSC